MPSPLSPPPPQPRDEVQAQLYADGFVSADDYDIDPGVCVLPLAEDPPTDPTLLAAWSPVVVLTLHAPLRTRRATGRAFKQNNPPVVPAPADTGAFVLVGSTMAFQPALAADLANFDWTVAWEHVYVENCPSRTADGFVLQADPWTWQTQLINQQTAGGAPPTPAGSAVSRAGIDAQVGFAQGQAAALSLNGVWAYNTPSFFPGSLMSTDLVNGGPLVGLGANPPIGTSPPGG